MFFVVATGQVRLPCIRLACVEARRGRSPHRQSLARLEGEVARPRIRDVYKWEAWLTCGIRGMSNLSFLPPLPLPSTAPQSLLRRGGGRGGELKSCF